MITIKLREVTRYSAVLTWKWSNDINADNRPASWEIHRGLLIPNPTIELVAIVGGAKFCDIDLDAGASYIYEVRSRGLTVGGVDVTELDAVQVDTEPELIYPNMVEFFTHVVAQIFARESQNDTFAWCPQWWRHPEANKVITELWRSWEDHRPPDDPTTPGSEQAEWLVMFAYPLIQQLLNGQHTFKGCRMDNHNPDIRSGHLPHEVDPLGKYQPDAV